MRVYTDHLWVVDFYLNQGGLQPSRKENDENMSKCAGPCAVHLN